MADFGIGEMLLADAAGEAAIADAVGLTTADLIGSGAVSGAGAGIGALSAADLVGSGAITDLTPSIASGAFDTGGFEGITSLGEASDPVARAIRAANMANVTGYAPGAFEGIPVPDAIDYSQIEDIAPKFSGSTPITELTDAQLAQVMRGVDPNYVNMLQPEAIVPPDYSKIEDFIPSAYSGPVNASQIPGFLDKAMQFAKDYKTPLMLAGGSLGIKSLLGDDRRRYGINQQALQPYSGPLSKFKYDPSTYIPAPNPKPVYYTPRYADGGPIEKSYDMIVGEPSTAPQDQSYARGGIASLGSYSDGGRMLRGPGDGMSDSIPAKIGSRQEARLADGEFVVPADVVSHLGNGSTDAGARQLYSMMDKVRKARTGRVSQGRQIKPQKYMPA